MKICRYLTFLLPLIVLTQVHGQEFDVGYGRMETANAGGENTFEFQYGYKQFFSDYLAASTMWLNEGHVDGHHRDGDAWQIWGELPMADDHFWLSLGVGAYDYFDTEGTFLNSIDYHGLAPIYSFSTTWYPTDNGRIFLKLTYNRVQPTGDIKTNTADVALGVWLGDSGRAGIPSAAPRFYTVTNPWETTLFGGWSVQNLFDGVHQLAWAAEVRKGIIPYLDATVSFIDERDLHITRRTGLATQIWADSPFFNQWLRLGIGVGIYTAVGPTESAATGHYFTPVAAPFFTPSITVKVSDHSFFRINWDRVTGYGEDGPDADVVLIGLGYRWD